MASIGRINPSAISNTNELTVAAAAFNLDFSLLKLEAPKAFHGVRDALSTRRLGEAETGVPHMTARRLGALFEAKIPQIKNLIETYGHRVSEICSGLENDIKHKPDAGLFQAQTGPDGTSIWAGATSGSGALAVHLLSCMLARIWKSHEAISLWVELVEKRKQEILSNLTDGRATELAAAMAAQQVITRENLAEWDASARSWLCTADSAMRFQQTQLTLIINNVGIAVNSSNQPYESVMQAWISALKTTEKLVQGIPQRVHNGAVLLAISSWHLYPDMEVLLDQTKEVEQNDKLMRGALITIPQQNSHCTNEGVYWSLPLSRMKFYSPPEIRQRHIASDTSRVTMDEFWIVMLGAIVGPWEEDGYDVNEACEFINFVEKRLSLSRRQVPWLGPLSQAASQYLKSSNTAQQQTIKLFGLGRRRCHDFLSTRDQRFPALFGLTNLPLLLRTIHDDCQHTSERGSPQQISVLREFVQGLRCNSQDLIIRYQVEAPTRGGRTGYAYASAYPSSTDSPKRTQYPRLRSLSGHTRWILVGNDPSPESQGHITYPKPSPLARDCMRIPTISNNAARNAGTRTNHQELVTEICHQEPGTEIYNYGIGNQIRCQNIGNPDDETCAKGQYCSDCYKRLMTKHVESLGETCEFIFPHHIVESGDLQFTITLDDSGPVSYELLLGEPSTIAIFKRNSSKVYRRSEPQISISERLHKGVEREALGPLGLITLQESAKIIREPYFDLSRLACHLQDSPSPSRNLNRSVQALVFATIMYEKLDGALVNLEIINLKLFQTRWVESLLGGMSYNRPFHSKPDGSTRLARRFACLAMFDSGYFDIDPPSLNGVFALSSGDSIYVSSALLSDPAMGGSQTECIKRVLGNLGRSGMTFLFTPAAPLLEAYNPKSWHLVNHRPFDGELLNSFTGTSLHLCFTDYEMPVDTGLRGLRDNPVVLAESVITLNDKSKKIGDLDVSPILEGKYASWSRCEHSHGGDTLRRELGQSRPDRSPVLRKLTSVDCWDELFDFPEQKGIFRATGNWQARIACIAASAQLGRKVSVLSQNPCLECISKYLENGYMEEEDVIIA